MEKPRIGAEKNQKAIPQQRDSDMASIKVEKPRIGAENFKQLLEATTNRRGNLPTWKNRDSAPKSVR